MTNIATDRRLKKNAAPFEALPFGLGRGGSSLDTYTILESDLTIFIRCATPYAANIITAALTLLMDVGSDIELKIGIGSFETDGVNAVTTTSQADIDRVHEIITGSSSPLASSGGVLFVDGVNIWPVIPKPGSTNYNPDGFVVILQFDRARDGDDDLKKFFVLCSAEMGLK